MALNFRAGAGSSSKSPSTPNRMGKSSLFSQAPSTTPAGPPPSYLTNKSTTPAGNPPRSSKIFGSSYNAATNTFGHRNTPGRRNQAFAVPESSPPPEEDEDIDALGEVLDEGYGTQTGRNVPDVTFMSSIAELDSPRGLKRSRDGHVRDQEESGMAEIARSFARDNGPASFHEPDDVVLQTENILSDLDDTISEHASADADAAIAAAASRLTNLWSQYAKLKTRRGRVGPQSNDPLTNANYLASLLLQLHNPHSSKSTFAPTTSRSQHTLMLPKQIQSSSIPLPRALLDWLDTHHNPFPDDFDEVHLHRPSPAAHESFWDIIGAGLLRGHFRRVIRLLKDAGFESAVTAQDDGGQRRGYHGKQLENVEEVVARYIRLLEDCPAVKYADWDVKGADWTAFRQRVQHAIKDLESFSKGSSEADEDLGLSASAEMNVFARSENASNFASMSAASMRAGSRVPWTVYENLKTMYGVLLGGDEILDFAQDWVEASISFTVWWDGGDGVPLKSSLAGRNSLRASRGTGAGTREVDVSPLTAYRRRLGEMFRTLTTRIDEPSFKPDSLDPIQVGLVCVIGDSVEAVIELLRSFDPSVMVAVVEIAALGDWLPQARPSSRGLLRQGFSSEDLMVLSHGPGQQRSDSNGEVDIDEILSTYADLLAARDFFRSSDGKIEKEGWELAISVLGRVDDAQASQAKIADILQTLQFQDETRVDKVLNLCTSMGLVDQAKGIAERYADLLASDDGTEAYGLALIYYARAHAGRKLKATISFLISHCLLQSAAIPSEDALDDQLASLLSKERAALVHLARVDPDAANLLSAQVSGYATVRQFYNLRESDSGTLKPIQRKRKAAGALIAVIESASDCIRGGLFDPEIESVVPIDGLLALLGEALPLLGLERRIFNKEQVFALMRVVEDFDTAPGRIRESAVELLQGSLNAFRNATSTKLKKSKSNISSMSESGLSVSSWDMVASSAILQSQESGPAVQIAREWDWRKGLDAVVEAQVDGKEVLKLLRMALAREVAKGWSGSVGW